MGNKSSKGRVELVVPNMDPKVKRDLQAIAKNKGTTLSFLLRPLLRDFRDKHPEHLRTWKP